MFQRFRIAKGEQEFLQDVSGQTGWSWGCAQKKILASWTSQIQKFLVAEGQGLVSKGQVLVAKGQF